MSLRKKVDAVAVLVGASEETVVHVTIAGQSRAWKSGVVGWGSPQSQSGFEKTEARILQVLTDARKSNGESALDASVLLMRSPRGVVFTEHEEAALSELESGDADTPPAQIWVPLVRCWAMNAKAGERSLVATAFGLKLSDKERSEFDLQITGNLDFTPSDPVGISVLLFPSFTHG